MAIPLTRPAPSCARWRSPVASASPGNSVGAHGLPCVRWFRGSSLRRRALCRVTNRRVRTLIAAAVALIFVGCTVSKQQPSPTRVRELRSISDLRERFNSDVGQVRLVLLISPT